MSDLSSYILKKFNVEPDIFLNALKLSPNAQGYLSGAITEFLLRDYLESKGYETKRIKEKWEGIKHPHHHGDFYIRKKGTQDWYVLESKGVKSNSEKWHSLFNYSKLISFLQANIVLTPFKSLDEIKKYVNTKLPLFSSEFQANFYSLNEIRKYTGLRSSAKNTAITALRELDPIHLEELGARRIAYVRSAVNVIETHLVSGGSNRSSRTQATPRIDEFHILSLDLFLRTGNHEFIFVNPKMLPPSSKDPSHLQQNYLVDILLDELKPNVSTREPWFMNIDDVYATLKDPVKESDMQADNRSLEEIADEISKNVNT